MHKFILYLFVLLIALMRPTELFAACTQLDGMRIPALSQYLVDAREFQSTKAARHIEPLKNVYVRIASVANMRPALIVCNGNELGDNAVAINVREGFIIVFDLPMLERLDGNIDEIAAVMAHEFSHLLLNHTQVGKERDSNLKLWANAIAREQYQRTGDKQEAIKTRGLREVVWVKNGVVHERKARGLGVPAV